MHEGATNAHDKVRLLQFPGPLVSKAKQHRYKWKITFTFAVLHMHSQVSAQSRLQWGIIFPQEIIESATSLPNVGSFASKKGLQYTTPIVHVTNWLELLFLHSDLLSPWLTHLHICSKMPGAENTVSTLEFSVTFFIPWDTLWM